MKIQIALLLLVTSLFYPAHAASTNTPTVTHVSLELRDGSRVVGVFDGKNLAVDSASVGEFKMPVERIRKIEWPSDKTLAALQATNGDKFQVELSLAELPIATSFGEIKVPVAKIRQLQFWTGGQGTVAGVLAGPIINPANGHSYYLLDTNTWTGAEAIAVALGGHLVTINDANEQDWVCKTFSTHGGVNRSFWIGLYDPSKGGNGLPHVANFVWASGEAVTYTHWYSGEPNGYNNVEFYGIIFGPPDSRATYWNDADNICSFNADGQTATPTYGVAEVAK